MGEWQGFLGAIFTLITAVVACANWINSRLNSLSKDMTVRFDGLDNKFVTRTEVEAMRLNSSERHREHERRINRLESKRVVASDDSEN